MDSLDGFLARFSFNTHRLIIFLMVMCVWIGYALLKGVVMSPDTGSYSNWADALVRNGFDYGAWLSEVENKSLTAPKVFYSTWITLVAFLKASFGDLWTYAVVLLNIAASALMVWLVLSSVWRLSGSRLAMLICGGFLGICFDYFLWIPYVLTDVVFSMMVVLVFLQMARSVGPAPSVFTTRQWMVIAGVNLLALFYRPAAVPLLVFSVTGMGFVFWMGEKMEHPDSRARRLRGFVASLFTVLLFLIAWHASIMQDPSRWPFAFAQDWVGVLSEEAYRGVVVYMRPETFHAPPENLVEFMLLTLGKFAAFFSFIHQDYSFAHKALNLVFFVPVYSGCLIAFVEIFRTGSGMKGGVWTACVLAALLMGTVGLYHAVNQIEYDHRFRVPVLVPMIFMSSLGWGHWLAGFRKSAG